MPHCIALASGHEVSDDHARLDIDLIHRFLATSYWAAGRSREVVARSIANSLCLGVYAPGGAQVGFGRIVTDRATTSHINDVFVLPEARGHGLGKALVAAMLGHPDLATVRRWTLSTQDAHGLYERFGFGPLLLPEIQMMRMLPAPA